MGQTKVKILGGLAVIALILIPAFAPQPQAIPVVYIDFEGLEEGAIIDQVSYGHGISGDPVPGQVSVFGLNPTFGRAKNAAMIFDATCLPGGTPADCSGGADDLFRPELGNILIVSANLNSSDPRDATGPVENLEFDFSGLGIGKATIESLDVIDIDRYQAGAGIDLYSGGPNGTLLASVPIEITGNNGVSTVNIGVSEVDFMVVRLNGSGAIDNIGLRPEFPSAPTDTPTPTLTSTPTQTRTPAPSSTPTATTTPTVPTAITLISFEIEGVNGTQVTLAWSTAAEIDNYGFHLYRSPDADISHASRILFEPANRQPGGNVYRFTDSVPWSGEWWYWLSDIDTAGRETFDRQFSPLRAFVSDDSPRSYSFQIFLPLTLARSNP